MFLLKQHPMISSFLELTDICIRLFFRISPHTFLSSPNTANWQTPTKLFLQGFEQTAVGEYLHTHKHYYYFPVLKTVKKRCWGTKVIISWKYNHNKYSSSLNTSYIYCDLDFVITFDLTVDLTVFRDSLYGFFMILGGFPVLVYLSQELCLQYKVLCHQRRLHMGTLDSYFLLAHHIVLCDCVQ